MKPILDRDDLKLCLEAAGTRREPGWQDAWRINQRQVRRWIRDRRGLQRPRFFCQNSGACGSTYLIQLLRDNGVAGCYHEKRPDLNALGIEHYERPVSASRLRALVRYTRWDIFLEANNRLFSLSGPLAESFPNCRFIHLFRDGREAVASALSKPEMERYLQRNLRFQGTLAGRRSQTPLIRFCHYWRNMNQRILDDLDRLNGRIPPVFYLSLSDLKQGHLDGLAKCLGVRLPVRRRGVVNRGRVGRQGQFPQFDDWTASQQRAFWEICGPTYHTLQTRHAAQPQSMRGAAAA